MGWRVTEIGWRTLFDGSDLDRWSVGGNEVTLLANQLERCVVKVRNIKVRLLRPTKKQLEEFHKHPLYNWLKHVEATK